MSEPRGRPFAPGNVLGRGRPKGSRNKAGSAGQQLLDDHEELLVRKCMLLAVRGSASHMRLCLERIRPACRDAYVRLFRRLGS
jgi:hypothetical protein